MRCVLTGSNMTRLPIRKTFFTRSPLSNISTYSPSVLWTVTGRSNMRVSMDFSSQSYPPNLVPTESRGRQQNLCRRRTDRPAPGLVFWALRYDLAVRGCALCQQRYQLPAIVTELVQEANQLIRTLEWLAMVFPFLHDYSPFGFFPTAARGLAAQPPNAPPALSSTCGPSRHGARVEPQRGFFALPFNSICPLTPAWTFGTFPICEK